MKLHREGIVIISVALFIMLSISAYAILEFTSVLKYIVVAIVVPLFFLIVYFFRKPSRDFTPLEKGIICPCDGKVVVIEEVEENEYFKKRCIQVSIFMSPLNVHINWYPMSGKVLCSKHHAGKYYKAWLPKSSTDNERSTIVIEREDKRQILVRQIAGAVARRIVTYAKKDNTVKQGDELGFIKFSSRVDVYLPLDADIKVKINDKVKGLQDIIAYI